MIELTKEQLKQLESRAKAKFEINDSDDVMSRYIAAFAQIAVSATITTILEYERMVKEIQAHPESQ